MQSLYVSNTHKQQSFYKRKQKPRETTDNRNKSTEHYIKGFADTGFLFQKIILNISAGKRKLSDRVK